MYLLCLLQSLGCVPTAWDGGGQPTSGTAEGLDVQIHTAEWDSPQGADSDGQIELGITTVTQKALETAPVLCLSLRWRRGYSQPCLES